MILSFIGAGRMCEALVKGIIGSFALAPSDMWVFDIKPDRSTELKSLYGVNISASVLEAVKIADVVILAVKPQDAKDVLSEIKGEIVGDKILLSIVAGLKIKAIAKALNKEGKIVRVMPNNPSLVGKGVSAISFGPEVDESLRLLIEKIFLGVGDVVVVEESLMDGVTALSGSGPAYFYLFTKLLIESGHNIDLDKSLSQRLVLGTMIGAAVMANETGQDLDDLIKMVASPKGTTEAALNSFNESDLASVVNKAVKAAFDRSQELGRMDL